MIISGAVFLHRRHIAWPEQFFRFERSIFDDEALTFRATMRSEPFRIRNFIDGQFVEPYPFLVIPSEVEESLDISACSLV